MKKIVYRKHYIKIKKNGECYVYNKRNCKLPIWGESLEVTKRNIDRSLHMDNKIKEWNAEEKKKAA